MIRSLPPIRSLGMLKHLTLLLCLWAPAALSQTPPDAASAIDLSPVRFATTTVKPWGIRSAGVNQGLLVSVINALEKQTGIPVVNELQPYPRVVHSLHSGHVDLAFLFDSKFSREEAIRIGHLVDTRMIVVGRVDASPIDSLDDLAGMVVGQIRGAKYGAEYDEATHFSRVSVSNMEQGLAMLLQHRVDVMAGSDQAIYWTMKKMNVGAKRLSKLFVTGGTSGSLYMSKNSKRKDLIPIYKKALQELLDNGTVAEIFDAKYEWANAEGASEGP